MPILHVFYLHFFISDVFLINSFLLFRVSCRCLAEDALHSTPYRLRLLFVLLLSHCDVINPTELFELHWRQMAYFWLKSFDEDEAKRICKQWIRLRVRANYGNTDDALYDGVPENQHVPLEGEVPAPIVSLVDAVGEFI